MWTRAELKNRAKVVLRTTYWKSLLVSIILLIVGGGGSSAGTGSNSGYKFSHGNGNFNYSQDWLFFLAVAGFAVMTVLVIATAFRIFLGYPLEVGGRKFFVEGARGDGDLNDIGFAFEKGKYSNVIKTMFFRGLYNFLWYLLFIIPGIIKYYSYRMVPYILSENPKMNTDKAIRLSMDMTKGHKLDMLVLDLSFIGWYIVGMLAFLIGTVFVLPYVNATYAELYITLRENAIQSGLSTEAELS
ncbi:MAG: DUF975 family protein [Eubacteriaceae bacterium]|nr:DUF975 family protein [Eubacteriaceae bacterium]